MTLSQQLIDPPSRPELSRHIGRIVTVEAQFTSEAKRLSDGSWIYMLRDVVIYPHLHERHLWLDLPMHARKRLKDGQRFSFRAEVISYQRTNGSCDFSLKFESLIRD